MVKGGQKLARGHAGCDPPRKRHRIPELGGMIRACRQNPSAVWTKRRVLDAVLMVKGGYKLARGRIPELGGFVRACRQNPSTVRTKRHVPDLS